VLTKSQKKQNNLVIDVVIMPPGKPIKKSNNISVLSNNGFGKC